ncbi:DUF4230 domain-containing protein [Nocardioides sp. 616]|uniref:DUF4230 domain-containing protein n=1 Tax=Nocardioides sp. 616 TaxID=2268090 RepID=UPI0013B452BA|nr:DUF4230 domain-containing protein [Nocardioides sp. 616]
MKRLLRWLATGVLLVLVAVGVVVALDRFTDLSILGTESESRDSQVINSVTREQEVVLLSLGIQGINEKKDNGTIGGLDIPFSERVSFLEYGFDAKLGIDGQDVKIEQSGEDEYVVTIPEFEFLGHDNESFRVVVEDEGSLSWTTPEIDTAQVITEILNDEAQQEYVDRNLEILRDQAQVFYTGIIKGIDPDLTVTFEFPT